MEVCRVKRCDSASISRGFCPHHYREARRSGVLENFKKVELVTHKKVCRAEGCDARAKGRGFCNTHYQKVIKYGTPYAGRTIAKKGEPLEWLEQSLNYNGNDCLIWPYAKDKKGYGCVQKDGKIQKVHRIIAIMVLGEPPSPKHETRHLCGNGSGGCIAKNHLAWGTQSENTMDRVEHGTSNRGERCASAKITEETVMKICKDDRLQTVIALEYGVSKGIIHNIKSGKNWGWLTGIKKKA